MVVTATCGIYESFYLGSKQLESIAQHLAGLGISAEDKLRTAGTHQYLAFHLLANNDGYSMTVPKTFFVPSRFMERYALTVFYYAT